MNVITADDSSESRPLMGVIIPIASTRGGADATLRAPSAKECGT
jgi:hypothetical protein